MTDSPNMELPLIDCLNGLGIGFEVHRHAPVMTVREACLMTSGWIRSLRDS
jgi:hypothetical protein